MSENIRKNVQKCPKMSKISPKISKNKIPKSKPQESSSIFKNPEEYWTNNPTSNQ